MLTRTHLSNAKPENLQRLARSLGLKTEGVSHEDLIALVYWTIELGVRFDVEAEAQISNTSPTNDCPDMSQS